MVWPHVMDVAERIEGEPELVVDVGGFEGPLDLLLDLARRQKVDLHEISVLALADQYIAFVERARSMRLELAADYLVMAAWLAYLKSRLLLPEPPKPEGESASELASALAARLKRLDAIRLAAQRLSDRPQLHRDVFPRGLATDAADPIAPDLSAGLYDLLSAYAKQRQRRLAHSVGLERRAVWSLAEARAALERLIGQSAEWVELDAYLIEAGIAPETRCTALASMLSAALEMVREGRAALAQDTAFGRLSIRARSEPTLAAVTA